MSQPTAAEAPEAMARAKFIRMSPFKARQLVDLIRGRQVEDARRVLQFTQRAASGPVRKVLDSAVANAEHNRGLAADELMVTRAWVDEGPTLRRYRPRALGRATRIRKRTCHISIVVARPEEDVPPPRGEDKGGRRRSRRRREGGSDSTAKKATERSQTTNNRKRAGKAEEETE